MLLCPSNERERLIRETKNIVLDKLQSRYHLPEAECLNISFARLKTIREQEKQAYRDRFIQGAFIAHQLGAGGKMPFGEYLDAIGLTERYEAQSKLTAAEIIARHEARKQRRQKGKTDGI